MIYYTTFAERLNFALNMYDELFVIWKPLFAVCLDLNFAFKFWYIYVLLNNHFPTLISVTVYFYTNTYKCYRIFCYQHL